MANEVMLTDRTSHVISKMMDMTQKRQEVLSHNLANANTPGFIRRDLDFISELREAMGTGETNDISTVGGSIVEDRTNPARMDGNNIKVSSEMNSVMQNGITFNMLTRAYNTRVSILRKAIK